MVFCQSYYHPRLIASDQYPETTCVQIRYFQRSKPVCVAIPTFPQYFSFIPLNEAGILTQQPAPEPKCQLNISSFLTLQLLLDCLICTLNSVSIVLLLWMMGAWGRQSMVDSHKDVGGGTGGGYYLIVCFFYLCFHLLVSHVLSLFWVCRAW